MRKKLKKLKCYLEETWTKLSKRTNGRVRTWKITETPVTDIKQSAAENTLNKDYPGGSVTTTKDDNTKEMDNTDHEKKEEGVMGWKAELLKFKAEAEEFNAELEKAMVRRRHCMITI